MTRVPARTFRLPQASTLVYAFALAVIVFLVTPVMIVIPMSISDTAYLTFPPQGFSLRWYEEIFTSRSWTRPARLSIRIALLASVFSTVIGTLAAYALVRGRLFGKGSVRMLIIAPNVVIAIAIFFAFVETGLIGTTIGFVLAHSILCIPFVVLTVTAALERFDPDLEMAAMNLGASGLTAFRRITLPIIAPGVNGGAVFSFIISFDEAVISYFISSVRQTTLPRQMFQNIETSVEPNVAAISTVLLALSTAIVITAIILRRTKGGAPTR